MPQVREVWQTLTENSLIMEHRSRFDVEVQGLEFNARVLQLNEEQQQAFDDITSSILSGDGQTYFLHGPGGTGKTFVYSTICARIRSEGYIVLCVSSSGISAIILPGGRTSYSLFRIPIEGLHERSVCSIPKDSERADLMRAARAIIWDEAGAQHRLAIEAVDRTLRDLRDDPRPFGGITTV
ncbi:PIF1-like helicase-domain-containing protein, partial [Coprinopsis sp. MPI-PUGE-AT-0042]